MRYSSIARADAGWVAARNGSDEGVGVPEHVTAVARSAEAAGADGRFGTVTDGRHQLEQRETRRNLQLVVALDDDVGVLPPARPGGAVLGEQPIEAG